ncbi:MAG: hypothetical protein SWE60_17620, partial [Thermodesulfobacteriota bacterium]|nr:hypothetical protein [Thermodesulfobacteriota bacterium]
TSLTSILAPHCGHLMVLRSSSILFPLTQQWLLSRVGPSAKHHDVLACIPESDRYGNKLEICRDIRKIWSTRPLFSAGSSCCRGQRVFPGSSGANVITMDGNLRGAVPGVALDLAVPAYCKSALSSQPMKAFDLCDSRVCWDCEELMLGG